MVTRIWHGSTPLSKSDEYLNLMRTVAIPDYRSTPGNKGAYALRRIEGGTAHFLMVTFWESEVAVRAFAGDDINVAKYYDFDKDFLLELEPRSSHYEDLRGLTILRPLSTITVVKSPLHSLTLDHRQ